MGDLHHIHCRFCEQTFLTTTPEQQRCDGCGKAGGLVSPEAAVKEKAEREVLRAAYVHAAATLDGGASPPQAMQVLVEKGLEPQVAKAVIEDLLAKVQAQARQPIGESVALQILGGFLFVVGIALFVGNVTGILPTLPFAGFIVTSIGGAFIGAGNRRR